VAVLFLLTGPAATAEPLPVPSVTTAAWDKLLVDNTHVLADFYAPWCGHCKKLNPEFDKAAELLKGTKVSLVKVDATTEKDLASKYNIKGFPTLVWFEGGKQTEYDGGRTSDTITDWVRSMIGPAVIRENPGATVTPVDGKPALVLHADTISTGFEEAAKANRRKASWKFVPSPGQSKIVVHHAGEEPLEYGGSVGDKDKITTFLMDNQLPMFGKMDGDTFDKYIAAGKGVVWSLFPVGEAGFDAIEPQYRPIMGEVAKKFRGKYFVTYTDVEKFKEPVENMLGTSEYPAIAVQQKAGDKKKYVYTGEMTAEKIAGFISDVEAGLVPPKLKSQPPPEPSDDPVTTCVGSTMRNTIFTPDKDVLLEVYAPWCGHCKKLEPEYNKLAKKIQQEELTDLLALAKIDGTANDSPVDSMDWTGFPTMYFIKAGTQEAIVYDGERTAKGLWKYIKKHATKAQEIRERLERRKGSGKRGEEL